MMPGWMKGARQISDMWSAGAPPEETFLGRTSTSDMLSAEPMSASPQPLQPIQEGAETPGASSTPVIEHPYQGAININNDKMAEWHNQFQQVEKMKREIEKDPPDDEPMPEQESNIKE